MFKRCFALFLTVIVSIGTVMYVPQNTITANAETVAWPTAPDLVSGSAILMDADTGAILYQKDCHARAYPASLTKIMTGLLTIENCSFDEIVTFSSTAANSVAWDEANISTKTGEQYTVEQALYGLLLQSANEVAYGLAEHISGSLSNFTNMMNSRAKELGALNTHFNNASGLSDTNHYTTAYDLAMIGRACFNNSTFMSFESYSDYYKLAPTNMTPVTRTLYGRHGMLKNREYYYEYAKGGKTGFTDESGYTLITFAEKDGMRLICVTLKASTVDGRYTDTKSLLDYGFKNFKKVSISNSDVSSLFNSSNYYNSKVFNNSTVNFSMNASYVDIPTTATLSDVGISVDTNNSNSADDYDYTANIDFTYGSNIVGTANLLVNTETSVIKSENLPYVDDNNSSTPTRKKCLVLNVWYVAGFAVILLLGIYLYKDIKRSAQMRRRRTYKRKNKSRRRY